MRIKTIHDPKTIKINSDTWAKLKKLQVDQDRSTLDETIWMLISRWENHNYDL